jgi:predicted AAA+ superfamily ATPase
MKSQKRSLQSYVQKDLESKMVLLSGPRQSGKTTFARQFLKENDGAYYNYDNDHDRSVLQKSQLPAGKKLWIFDEIHKNPRWRNWLKGIYDQHHEEHSILVTGSAKLDIYSRGGDSLQGRYFFYRFHPLTLGELCQSYPSMTNPEEILQNLNLSDQFTDKYKNKAISYLDQLIQFGPFPEPFFQADTTFANRWRLLYSRRVIREDLRDLEKVSDLSRLELLYDRLPALVGSVLSLNSLREDLEVSHDSVKRWIEIFDRLFLTYRISPFGPVKIKSVKKEQKLFMMDWGLCEDTGARLENLVANHLLRFTHWCEDVLGVASDLRFFRNTDRKEVDFVVLKKKSPWFCVEVKSKQQSISPNLRYLMERTSLKQGFQVHLQGDSDYQEKLNNGAVIRCMPLWKFLLALP